jgi:fluoride ion exporter CrcB/FEX
MSETEASLYAVQYICTTVCICIIAVALAFVLWKQSD